MDSLKRKLLRHFFKAKHKIANFYFFSKGKLFHKEKLENDKFKQTKIDRKLVYSLSKSKIPNLKQIKYIKKFLNLTEIRLIRFCFLIILLCSTVLAFQFYKTHTQIVPAQGGEYIEGMIGRPELINPLYSGSGDVDNDIASLVFSKIFKRNGEGNLINDLAVEYKTSEDNKIYYLTIKDNVKWHNGDTLTADDIVFTFNAIKNKQYKSSLYSSFLGVFIEKINDNELSFTLTEPYSGFLELLTFGIIPQKLWSQISPESANLASLNLKPIGSGPYKFKSLTKDKNGYIKNYDLIINEDYYGKKPYIKELIFKFFASFEEADNALNENTIDGISYLPKDFKKDIVAQESLSFNKINLPQISAIFFNTKKELLADKKIRQALSFAIDKNVIISNIFEGNANIIDGPILKNNFAYNSEIKKYEFNLEEAEKILDETGWKKEEVLEEVRINEEGDIIVKEEKKEDNTENTEDEENEEKIDKENETLLLIEPGQWRLKKTSTDKNKYLVINLKAVDTEDNIKIINFIKESWERIGVKTNIAFIPADNIRQNVINPRTFDALLYGQILGADPDSYAFWHSTQTTESGLNISGYSNENVDKLLEEGRTISDKEERIKKYKEFQNIISEDAPAIFLYSSIYIYPQDKKIKGFKVENILMPYDRFSNIEEWYVKTRKKIVW